MQITDIKLQVKTANRFSVYVDGVFKFGIDQQTLLENSLKVGSDLDETSLLQLQKKADTGKYYVKCVEKVYCRPHSEKEIRDYLYRKDKPEYSDIIVAKLRDKKLLDDVAFASWLVDGRRRSKQRSSRALQAELRAKGVEPSIIHDVLKDTDIDESAALTKLVDKKRRMTRYQDDTKLLQYLVRQGFSYSDCKDALRNCNAE